MDPMDRDYLAKLVEARDADHHAAGLSPRSAAQMRAYYQGRIDEYCAQNAIDEPVGMALRLDNPWDAKRRALFPAEVD